MKIENRSLKIANCRRRGAGSVLGAMLCGVSLLAPSVCRAEGPPATQTSQLTGHEFTPEETRKIDGALLWLSHQQKPDGSWDNSAGGASIAITSLCGLAFMANGNLPGRGKYGDNVRKAVDFICRCQQESGFFSAGNNQGEMYSHGFATLFIAEVYGMTGDDEVKENLSKAVRLIQRCQNDQGGWRYQPAPYDADISVTICQIMGLRAARDAGIKVEATVIKKAIDYVKRCQNPDGGFSYQARGVGGSDSGFARTAAGVASLYYAGIFDKDQDLAKGVEFLYAHKPTPTANEDGNFYYGNYYAAQAMFLAGGKYWADWYPAIRDNLINRAKTLDHWTGEVDDCYSTSMALIILQIPNRYLPVFNGKGPGS